MPKTKSKEKMVLISVHLPKQILEELDELVKRGIFPSRSEAIRIAIRDLMMHEGARNKQSEETMLITGR
ncbi:MAG: ribbon-helix-helix domain-containing protein [Thermocladium sp.]|jgi:Arc/MetJ-type ribon-helix-helix transcriptional regulator|nr:MAG: CopG family transcriptional regulator [Thermocladium sp. ECH_B]